MLQEKKIIDLIEILNNNCLQIREAIIIEKDGNILAKTFNRFILKPGDDVSMQDQKIKDVTQLIWTEEVINNFKSLGKGDSI